MRVSSYSPLSPQRDLALSHHLQLVVGVGWLEGNPKLLPLDLAVASDVKSLEHLADCKVDKTRMTRMTHMTRKIRMTPSKCV